MFIHDVEQGSEAWHKLRAGLATASEFSKLVTSTGAPSKSMEKYAMTLAGQKYAGKELDAFAGNVWTANGNETEEQARDYYAFMNKCSPELVGFVTDKEVDPTYGISPDSLINDDGLLEIKCLKAESHIETMLYYRKHSKCPPKYVPQTQGQLMAFPKRLWNDLLFFHPDLPPFTIRQQPDIKVILPLKKQIIAVNELRDEILKTIKSFDEEN